MRVTVYKYPLVCFVSSSQCYVGLMLTFDHDHTTYEVTMTIISALVLTNKLIYNPILFCLKGCQMYTVQPCGFPRTHRLPCDYSSAITPKCKRRRCNNDWYKHKVEPDEHVYKGKKR